MGKVCDRDDYDRVVTDRPSLRLEPVSAVGCRVQSGGGWGRGER